MKSNVCEFKDYILEKLERLGNVRSRAMMGGYLFYYNNIYFGGIYESGNFLIKKTINNFRFNLEEEIPYKGAKEMWLVEDLDNDELLEEIVITTYEDLINSKK